jgi:N6-adenosine-specific RNA methylase IME4
MTQRRFHEVASIFPMMSEDGIESLARDIEANGQVRPVIVHPEDGSIIDGRNRFMACRKLGREPITETWDGKGSLVAYVISLNLARRHLDLSQQSMAAARAKPLFEAEAKKRSGARTDLQANLPEGSMGQSRDKVAAVFGVSGRSVSHAETVIRGAAPEVVDAVDRGELAVSAAAELSRLEPEKQRAVLARTSGKPGNVRALVKQVEKAEVAAQLNAEPPPMPAGPFRVIVSDPPWAYEKRAGDATHRGDLPYPSMTTEEICALPVGELAHDDGCVLWLWTTNAFMRDAYRVLDAWGFQEKTILTWVKDRMGLGDWLRGQTEHCILAVRGRPTVTLTNQTTALHGPMREHSRKPDEFYALVEALCPGSRVEMFARQVRDGWSPWGAESSKFGSAA